MEDLSLAEDKVIVGRSLENPDYFVFIIRKYEDAISRYVRRRTNRSADDIVDIVQEIFIKVYRNLNDFDSGLSFSSWIYRIAHNHIIDWYRKEKKHDHISIDEEYSGVLLTLAGGEEADKESFTDEIKKEVGNVLKDLPDVYKDILILRFFEDKSYEEISDIVRIPVSLVGVRINRAKSMIKKKLLAK